MTQHPLSLKVERQVPASEIMASLHGVRPAGGDAALLDAGTPSVVAKAAGEPLRMPNEPANDEGPRVAPARTGRLRKLLLVGAGLLALAGASYFGWQYWTVGRFEVSTDDAYVQADNTIIAP
jgi:membrane fusion protein (multidrug efflux system)